MYIKAVKSIEICFADPDKNFIADIDEMTYDFLKAGIAASATYDDHTSSTGKNLVEQVRLIRNYTGWGLRDAVNFVKDIRRDGDD